MSVMRAEFRMVGKTGHLRLGKDLAGKTFRVQEQADGSLLLTPVEIAVSRERFQAVLSKVPDVPPDPEDEL
ncbi:MAG TPA: hypothetical protein VH394_17385 [Thermoanaerobaculia bacterium]|nr:hypothetical protein [Thermoanaerobaculia bacterium]